MSLGWVHDELSYSVVRCVVVVVGGGGTLWLVGVAEGVACGRWLGYRVYSLLALATVLGAVW